MFKRSKALVASRPTTPKIPKIELPDMGGGDDTVTTKALKSPVKRSPRIEQQTCYMTDSETPAVRRGRGASKRRDDSIPTCGESSGIRRGSSLTRGEVLTTGGRPSMTMPKVTVRLVPMKTPAVNLHWQLLPYNPRLPKPRLLFDIAHSIYSIRFTTCRRPPTEDELNKPAADEKLCEMVIQCERFPDWPVRINRQDGIRCRDVFTSIYETYSKVLSPAERRAIPSIHLKACERAFKERCNASANLPAWEERQGLRRVDLLRGETIFIGLTRPKPTGEWVLHVGGPTRTL